MLRFSQTSYITVTTDPFDPSVFRGIGDSTHHSPPILFASDWEVGSAPRRPWPLAESASLAGTICSSREIRSHLNDRENNMSTARTEAWLPLHAWHCPNMDSAGRRETSSGHQTMTTNSAALSCPLRPPHPLNLGFVGERSPLASVGSSPGITASGEM